MKTPLSQHKKTTFLNNEKNKQNLVNRLGECLEYHGFKVLHSRDDADFFITKTAVRAATTKPAIVIGDDTDLLCLLVFHTHEGCHQMTLSTSTKSWNIQHLRLKMGEDMCKHIFFLHAFSGCDTTSRIFLSNKDKMLKLYSVHPELRRAAAVFSDKDSTKKDIVDAGEKRMLFCTMAKMQNP